MCGSPPHTTTQKLKLNYKTTIAQNCQKIKLYGSPTTKELKKSHSFRRVGGKVTQRHGSCWLVPHPPVVAKNQKGYLRSKVSNQTTQPKVLVAGR